MSRKTLGHGCRGVQGPIRSGTRGDLGRDSLGCVCSRAAACLPLEARRLLGMFQAAQVGWFPFGCLWKNGQAREAVMELALAQDAGTLVGMRRAGNRPALSRGWRRASTASELD